MSLAIGMALGTWVGNIIISPFIGRTFTEGFIVGGIAAVLTFGALMVVEICKKVCKKIDS